MLYRREIDGLRAIAVIAVILFHAGFDSLSGGFIGVDVFFVISGYLITSIILAELRDGTFSITHFYERRARRILPALFAVMIASLPLAWLLLPATEMRDFGQSVAAVALFFSNVLFLYQSGYFDTAAELKPLLHTWSLAVEEQYYIFFPIVLLILWRYRARQLMRWLSAFLLASLLLAQWASVVQPAAAFYLLPTRAWELLLGASAALYLSRNHRITVSKTLAEVAGFSGLVLIGFSAVVYSKLTPFPGFYALAPTLGALLIILFSTRQSFVGRLLGSRLLVGIGLASYSAYLWHQPIFAFVRHAEISSDLEVRALQLLLVALLSYVGWKYIESPFRSRQNFSRGQILLLSTTGAIFFIVIGGILHLQDGFPKAYGTDPAHSSVMTNRDFIVIGDSHGGHLISGLRSITSGKVAAYTEGGCIPFRNVDRYDYRLIPGECATKVNRSLDKIVAKNPDAILLLSSMGPVYLDGTAFKGKDMDRVTGLGVELITDPAIKDRWQIFEIGLRSTLLELSRLTKATVVFALDVPELGIDYGCAKGQKEFLFLGIRIGDLLPDPNPESCGVSRQDYDDRVRRYRDLVASVVSEFPNVHFFDPAKEFCDDTRCKGFDQSFGYLYRDADHLSKAGSRFYASALVRSLGLI